MYDRKEKEESMSEKEEFVWAKRRKEKYESKELKINRKENERNSSIIEKTERIMKSNNAACFLVK